MGARKALAVPQPKSSAFLQKTPDLANGEKM